MWNTYTDPPHDSITAMQVFRLIRGNVDPFDLFGWFATIFEWSSTYIFLWPQDGRMRKEDVKGVYNGSIFWEIEKQGKKKEN
ncbi:hypothetical protein FRC02_006407 [Tulasnella sp. 418]|nr:hypothetical protein FRC02_006407 [Tulasnella sp. 418]